MKTCIAVAAGLSLLLCSLNSSAQMDERAPGLYAVVGGESIALPYVAGIGSGGGMTVGAVEIGGRSYLYKGITSGVNAEGEFVLVVDPNLKLGTITRKKFNSFTYKMTPEDMLILPLVTNEKKNRREYDPGMAVGLVIGSVTIGGGLEQNEHPGFEWERISDNSFRIKIPDLDPGEYGIVFRVSRISSFEYFALFGFTVPQPALEAPQK